MSRLTRELLPESQIENYRKKVSEFLQVSIQRRTVPRSPHRKEREVSESVSPLAHIDELSVAAVRSTAAKAGKMKKSDLSLTRALIVFVPCSLLEKILTLISEFGMQV